LGKRIQALAAPKNHLVVMPDADIEQAVDGLIGAAYAPPVSAAWRSGVAVLWATPLTKSSDAEKRARELRSVTEPTRC